MHRLPQGKTGERRLPRLSQINETTRFPQNRRHRGHGRPHPRRMRQTAAAHSAARLRRPVRAGRRRLGAHALPAVLGGMRHHRSRDAGRVDSHDRRPAEARQGGTGEEDRGEPRTSDQHGRHMRARPGGRAGALPSRSHSDAAQALGTARVGTISADHLERGAAAARDAASAAAGDAAGDRAPDRPPKSRHDGHDRRTVRRRPRHDERRHLRSVRSGADSQGDGAGHRRRRGCPPWISRTRTTCCRSTRICSRRSSRPSATSTRTAISARDGPGIRGKFVHAEPRLSQTAACADEWLPIKPGTEGLLALAIAHVIVNEKLYDAEFVGQSTGGFAEWSASLGDYAPEKDRGADRRARGVNSARRARVCQRAVRASPSATAATSRR